MTPRSPHRKTLLHCPICGHQSPTDGDWRERVTTTDSGDHLVLACPDCEAILTRRPIREAAGSDAGEARDGPVRGSGVAHVE